MSNSLKKKQLVLSVALSTELKEIEGNKLILVTPFGVVQGILMPENPKDDGAKIYSRLLGTVRKKWEETNGGLSGDDGYLLLSDVKIKTGPNTFNTPFLMVFYDQIIGVTVGNFD